MRTKKDKADIALGVQRGCRKIVSATLDQDPARGSVQVRAIRSDGWTPKRRALFMATLQATANVSEAARVAGKCQASAYNQRRRDPGFARDWQQALAVGYAELEALLLRQALFGTETEEIIQDAAGEIKSRKVKRGHPNTVGIRLLLAHRQSVRETQDAGLVDRPDGPDAIERLRVALDMVRARQLASEEDEEGA